MQLEQIVAHTTSEGNEYLVQFSSFNPDFLPKSVNLPVINLELVQVKLKKQNSPTFLKFLAQYICDYVNTFDVILYYYCDTSEIYMRKTRAQSPQEYRHELFNRLYNTIQNESIIREVIIIEDINVGKHYISLITSEKFRTELDIVSKEFEYFRDK